MTDSNSKLGTEIFSRVSSSLTLILLLMTTFLKLTLMVRLAHLKVMADLTRFAAPPMAAGISAGEGGISSALPYFSAVARRGLAYTERKVLNFFLRD